MPYYCFIVKYCYKKYLPNIYLIYLTNKVLYGILDI
jgi:hypothetical protein